MERKENTPFVLMGAPVISSSPRLHAYTPTPVIPRDNVSVFAVTPMLSSCCQYNEGSCVTRNENENTVPEYGELLVGGAAFVVAPGK